MRAAAGLVLFATIVGCGPRAGPLEPTAKQIGREALLSAKVLCAEQGRKYISVRNSDRTKGSVPIHGRFAYNERLNTCICLDGTLSADFKYESIIDILEDTILAEHFVSSPRAKATEESIRSEREFDTVKKKLFVEPELRLAQATESNK